MMQYLLGGEISKGFFRNNIIECSLPVSSFRLHRTKFPLLAAGRSEDATASIAVSSGQRTPVAEAERLIEEQLRLLEAEREESLAIARSCTARSKRLLARLDNLKTYNNRSTAARRTSIGPSRTPQPGSHRPSNLDARPQRTPSSTAPQPLSSQPTEPLRQRSNPAARSPLNNAAGSSDPSQSTSSSQPHSSSDAQEAQTRRLVSRGLQRNIARGENNMALAGKLQVYIGVLRDELTRVRRGDVALSAKLLDEHRARTAATAAGPQPPSQRHPDLDPSQPNSLSCNGASDGATSSSGANNSTADTASHATTRTVGTTVNTVVISSSLASGASERLPSSSTVQSADNSNLAHTAGPNGPSNFNGPNGLNDPKHHNGSNGGAATVPSGQHNTQSSPSTASSPVVESSDSGAHGGAAGDTPADTAGGLGRIFSRTALLTLPGDPVGGSVEVEAAAMSSGRGEWDDDVTLPVAAVAVSSRGTQTSGRLQPADVENSSQGTDDDTGAGELSNSSSNISSASDASSTGDRSGLGLSLSDARSLALDSEEARKALLGLLQPSGYLAGPLDGFMAGRGGGGSAGTGAGSTGLPGSLKTAPADGDRAGPEAAGAAAAAEMKVEEEVEATRASVYALVGDEVPHRATRIVTPSAAGAAAVAVAATAAAAAAAAAAQADGAVAVHADSAAGDVRQLVLVLGVMVSELRRRGYVGCDVVMETAQRALEAELAAARASVTAARVKGKV